MIRMAHTRLFQILIAFLVCAALFLSVMATRSFAANTIYYVDSVGGNDTNNGTSVGTAWKTLTQINGTTFQPGDQILFKAGGTWTGQLHPLGSGVSGQPIIIGMYGTGNKPLIQGQGQVENAVYLYNQQYWDIGNLEITNYNATAATSPRRGVLVRGEDYQKGSTNDLSITSTLSGIRIHDLYIHDVNGQDLKDEKGSAGIQVSVLIAGLDANSIPATGSVHRRTKFDSVTIENNVVSSVSRGGIVTWSDWKNRAELGDNIVYYGNSAYTPWTPFTNVIIRNNTLSNIGGDGIVPHMTTGALVERNVLNGYNKTSAGYNAGMWTWDGDYTVYQYNEVSGGYSTRDGMPFDFDHASRGIVYQYNYSHDNDGGTLLFCADGASTGGVYDGVFRYNISQNDKYKLFVICGASNVNNVKVYNNVFYVKPGMSTTMLDAQGGATQVAFSNNIFYNLGSGGYTKKTSWTYDHNVFYGNNVPSTTTIPDSTMLTSNPLLANPGTGSSVSTLDGYKLLNGSPALGNGAVLSNNGGSDPWGNAVSATTAPNRGVYNGAGITAPAPTNLVTNPGFELGASSWTAWNASVVAGNALEGSYAAKLTGGAGSYEQTISGLLPNTTYTLVGYAKTDSDVVNIGVKSYGGPENYVGITTTAYSQGSVTFTTGSTNTSVIIYFWKPNAGNTAYGDKFSLTKNTEIIVDDSDPSITFSGAWTSYSDANDYSGTEKYSNTTNNYAQFTFTGTTVSYISMKQANMGKVDVYIDGVLDLAGVDCYASTTSKQQVVYTKTGLSNASHTIKVVVTGTKNASSSGYFASVDAFKYTN